MEKTTFGVTPNKEKANLYTMENKNGMRVTVTDFGAILVRVVLPGKEGEDVDVCLGYDTLEEYLVNEPFFGATIGPNGNRIAGASFELDGITYRLEANDGGNNLHSHPENGFHKRVWQSQTEDNSVVFSLESEDGDLGFPGNKSVSVSYTLTEENELIIEYFGQADKRTVFNMTNHSYFNLAGHNKGNIENHELWLKASCYTPVAEGLIPTGEIAPVEGTPMDFTLRKRIGDDINEDFNQLVLAGGYDHNWVIDDWDGDVKLFAVLEEKDSKRGMEAYTDQPGVQFYAGNFIKEHTGRQGASYQIRSGLCLETQNFPNAVNEPKFPSPFYGPDREYHTTTIYKFMF